MITTTNCQIKKTQVLTSEYIEEELEKNNIIPLRWAIVGEVDDYWLVSVSFEVKCK